MTTTAPVRRPTPAATAPRRSFGPLLLRLHFYAGVLVAPFLLVAALTGLAYVFTPQLERIVYADELVVAAPGGPAVPLARQIQAARATHPDGEVTAVRPGTGDTTTQIDFTAPGLDDEHFHTVYVNPYTGAVTGQLTTWWATTPVRTWFDDLHRNLHLGAAGRHYSEFAASWLWIIALGGIVLWWRRHRRGRRARMLVPDLAAGKGVRRTRGWHAATGVWLAAGLIVLSATGLTWSRYAGATFSSALDALRSGTPAVATSAGGADGGAHHGGGGDAAGGVDVGVVDGVLAAARADGIDGPVAIAVPAGPGTAWTVTQTRDRWPVGRDSVAVDGRTGAVTDRVAFADWPVLAKLSRWGINAHMGTLFGWVNQVLLAALAAGLICVIVWGYRMWWQRRPTRAGRRARAGAPPARGAWQQVPGWGIVAGVPVVFVLAWVLPMVGVPLIAFLVADLAVGALRTRRRPPVPVSPAPAGR